MLEQAGVPSYWLLDPQVPSLTVLTVERPLPLASVPSRLLR